MRRTLFAVALAAGAALGGQANAATSLLTNGSFETGDLTGWTTWGDFSYSGVYQGAIDGVAPEEGNYQVYLGSVYATGGITQTFADTAGQEYVVTGWYTGLDIGPSLLGISLDSMYIINLNPAPSDGVDRMFSYTFVGTGSDTLTVASYQLPSYNLVDNFSVTAVPEASTWAMMLAGFAVLGFAARRGRGAVVSRV